MNPSTPPGRGPHPAPDRPRFGLLGPLAAHDAAGRPISLTADKSRVLLALLLVEANTPVSRDRITDALWGDRPPPTAGRSINNHIAQVRRALDPGGAARLATVPVGYLFHAQPEELDTTAFMTRLDQARAAHGRADWPAVERSTDAALGLWRGRPLHDLPALADQYAPFVEHLAEARLQALEWRLDARLATGLAPDAMLELVRLTAEHPLHEGFHGQLMLAHYRSGRQAEALGLYGRIRRRLADELGIDPGPALQELHLRILGSDPALAAPTAPIAPTSPTDGPAARRPGDAADTDPATATPRVRPAQLPSDMPDFTGREPQIERLLAALGAGPEADGPDAAGPSRPTLISGAGGVGKTTLAVHTAHRARDHYPDGQLYADLHGGSPAPSDPAEILARFLRDLGVATDAIPDDAEERAALYRSTLADRRTLVVLDDARDTAQIRSLLPGGSRTGVLITSRTRLAGLDGAYRLDLELLDDDAGRALFAGITSGEPAAAAAEPAAMARLLQVCGGLPLAIRIAAARLVAHPDLSVRTLADRLADHSRVLDELTVEDRAVRSCFAASFEALAEQPRSAFARLGVWQGHALSAAAARALLTDRESGAAHADLTCLTAVHLVQTDRAGRYRFHDLMRVYAAEQAADELSGDERRAALSGLFEWYLHAVDEALRHIAPHRSVFSPDSLRPVEDTPRFEGPEEALEWLEDERENLNRLTSQGLEHGLEDRLILLADALIDFYGPQRHWTDYIDSQNLAITAARRIGDGTAEAVHNNCVARALMEVGRFDEAIEAGEKARAHYLSTDDVRMQAASTETIALVHYMRKDFDQARPFFEEALTLRRADDYAFGLVATLNNIGNLHAESGRPVEAARHHEESIAIARENGWHSVESTLLTAYAISLGALEQYDKALVRIQEAVALLTELGEWRNVADRLETQAKILEKLDDAAGAAAAREQAAGILAEEAARAG